MKVKLISFNVKNFLFLLLVILTPVVSLQAQSSTPKSKILGYWKRVILSNGSERIQYVAFLENDMVKTVPYYPQIGNTYVQKYWFESEFLKVMHTNNKDMTFKWKIEWVSDNEFLALFVTKNDNIENSAINRYMRISQNEYEEKTGYPLSLTYSKQLVPKVDIIGYWCRKEISAQMEAKETYYHFSSYGFLEKLTFTLNGCTETDYNYMVEGDILFLFSAKQSSGINKKSYWLSPDEFCLENENGSTFTRVNEAKFAEAQVKALNCLSNNTKIYTPNLPEKSQHYGFRCLICLDTGKIHCMKCNGTGRIKYAFRDDYFTCSNCVGGREACTNFQCPFR